MGTYKRWLGALLGAMVLVGAVYANSLHNGFHFDDGHSIQDNTYLTDLGHVGAYFTDVATFSPLAENRSYRPLLLVGYAVSHAVGGGAPWAFHLGSMLLHAFAAFIIALLARRLMQAAGHSGATSDVAMVFAGGVFAVHPLLSETVNYLSARSSLQGAAFAFAAVLLYVQGREDERPRRIWGSAAVLAAAMLSKLTAITVPALLIAWELLLGPDRLRVREVGARTWARRLAPAAMVALALTITHEAMVGAYARGARSIISPTSHLLTQTQVWLRYQGLFVWPEDLCADLTMPWSEDPFAGPTARAILFVLALAVAGWGMRRRLPLAVFGLIWFYVTLSPTNSIVPLSEPATEHRVYIALPGLLMVVLDIAARLATTRLRRALIIGGGLAAVTAFAVGTVARNRVWSDDVSLWGSVLQCAPDNGRAHLNYGRGLLLRGDREGARRAYAKCAELWPGYVFCPINQAALAWTEGRWSEADLYASQAMRLQPNNVYANYWRGRIDLSSDRFAAAEQAFLRTLEIAPGYEDGLRGLAIARFELGRLDEARQILEPLAARNALDADGWYAWGFLEQRAGRTSAALEAYDRALALDAGHRRARYNRAVVHHQAGRLQAALVDYKILAAQPDPAPDALFNQALAELAVGAHAFARETRDRLEALAPTYRGLPELDRALGPPPTNP